MSFPPPTYILQQQAGQQPDLPPPDFSYRHTFSAPSAQLHQPYAPISVGQRAHCTTQPQEAATQPRLMSQTEFQTHLDIALRKNREYEETILHLATLSRPCQSLRTQHGIICPGCKQEVAHACSSPSHSLIPSSSLQPPLSRYERQPLCNPTALQTDFTDPTGQGNLFGQHLTTHFSASHMRPLPPSGPDISSVFTSLSTNHYPPTSMPCLTVTSPSGAMPLSPPSRFIAIHSQNDSSNGNSWSGKRDLLCADLECEPERKKVRQNFPEKRINRQSKPLLPHCATTSNLRIPSFKDSLSPLDTTSSSEGSMLPPVPESPTTTSGGGVVTSGQEIGAEWSIRYNSEVERRLDVTFVRSLDVRLRICCLKFSKDGKHLAVGSYDDGTTNIYDMQTEKKTCTLRDITIEESVWIQCVCFSPDGLYLATGTGGTGDDSVRIWEISKKHVRNALGPLSDALITCIDFSPDGRLIALGNSRGDGGSFRICNWRDGSQKILEALETDIDDICFSPDGQYIAVVGDCEDVMLWNVRTRQLVEKFGHSYRVGSVTFMPDGLTLVSGSYDRTVRFWDTSFLGVDGSGSQPRNRKMEADFRTGKNLKQVLNFKECVTFVAVSSDSRWVVSSSYDGTIHIWNALNFELHCELRRHEDEFPPFAFSPVGSCMASAFWDSQVLLWKFKEV